MCQPGHESVLSLSLDINVVDRRSLARSRLVINAVESESERALELLLERGADASARCDEGCLAPRKAAKIIHEPSARMLLVREVDIKVTDTHGWTALH